MALKVLYHGTDIESAKKICSTGNIDVDYGSDTTDFGKGFYTTDSIEYARNWANRKSGLRGFKPAIIKMYFDEEAAESIIERFQDDFRWGQFIINNRNGEKYIENIAFREHNLNHQYQITIGRIADLDVVDIARELKRNKRMLDSLTGILNLRYPQQIAFHTQYATTFIKKLSYQHV